MEDPNIHSIMRTFIEYIKMMEDTMNPTGIDPLVNAKMANNIQSLSANPATKGLTADQLINKGIEDTVTKKQATPGAVMNALKPKIPGQVTPSVRATMKKKMKKK